MLTKQMTLGRWVAQRPESAKVFHRYGFDFCCGGGETLAEACAGGGVDVDAVVGEIEDLGSVAQADIRWDERPIDELVGHIVDHYHASLRQELPRLVALAQRVADVHDTHPDHPAGLVDLLVHVQAAVEGHLDKEEQILFPLILSGRGQTARMPVQVMIGEHRDHGENLRRLRRMTGDFEVPSGACASWRALYGALSRLEMDLMEHIHLENNVLFPRVLCA